MAEYYKIIVKDCDLSSTIFTFLILKIANQDIRFISTHVHAVEIRFPQTPPDCTDLTVPENGTAFCGVVEKDYQLHNTAELIHLDFFNWFPSKVG